MHLSTYFLLDPLAISIAVLVFYIALSVGSFALKYLQGDTKYSHFFIFLALIIFSVTGMVSTDHLGLLFIGFCISNFSLIMLMIHKPSWLAAKASGILAAKNFLLGGFFLLLSFVSFFLASEGVSIHYLNNYPVSDLLINIGLIFLVLTAMTQSGIWPFHRWLISSLNSPTPVSAIMHAGLVNGGGFLLIRFAPLLIKHPYILDFIFFVGLITAVVGTGWKLLQHDVKRMLACSTMGQMGFMFVECGLGLFPIALVHICCHSLFKSYLFLSSGSAAQEKRLDLGYPPKKVNFCLAILCGLLASFFFNVISRKAWIAEDTTLFINVLIFITSCQIGLTILDSFSFKKLSTALLLTSAFGVLYGYSNFACEEFLSHFLILRPQPLHLFHWLGMILLLTCWLSFLFVRQRSTKNCFPEWMLKFYVRALNRSQPHYTTVTTHRTNYKYL